mmetsp:Transcript_8614/g.14545  ORF Transcript_8614/g.14545 Transcript_8614/m.14545 type:complete len:387 (+) Transcript_8614:264-1424(+)
MRQIGGVRAGVGRAARSRGRIRGFLPRPSRCGATHGLTQVVPLSTQGCGRRGGGGSQNGVSLAPDRTFLFFLLHRHRKPTGYPAGTSAHRCQGRVLQDLSVIVVVVKNKRGLTVHRRDPRRRDGLRVGVNRRHCGDSTGALSGELVRGVTARDVSVNIRGVVDGLHGAVGLARLGAQVIIVLLGRREVARWTRRGRGVSTSTMTSTVGSRVVVAVLLVGCLLVGDRGARARALERAVAVGDRPVAAVAATPGGVPIRHRVVLLQDVPQHLPCGGQLNNQLLSRGRHVPHRSRTTQLLVTSTIVAVHVMLVLVRIQRSLLGDEQIVRGACRAAAAVEWRVGAWVRAVRCMRRVGSVRGVVRHVRAAVVTLFVLLVRAISLSSTRLKP